MLGRAYVSVRPEGTCRCAESGPFAKIRFVAFRGVMVRLSQFTLRRGSGVERCVIFEGDLIANSDKISIDFCQKYLFGRSAKKTNSGHET